MKIKDRAKPAVPPMEPGVYVGVCVGVLDLGEQYSENFKKYSNDVRFIWEIPGETVMVDGEEKPRQLSRTFTISAGKKSNLRKFLSSWNGKAYTDGEFGELELFDQLGKGCQLQVVLSEDGQYNNIDNLMGLPKGMPAPKASSPFIKWDMDQWDEEAFQALPDWAREKIEKSTQYQKLHAPENKVEFETPPAKAEPAAEECPI